jgi:hypothetical protein
MTESHDFKDALSRVGKRLPHSIRPFSRFFNVLHRLGASFTMLYHTTLQCLECQCDKVGGGSGALSLEFCPPKRKGVSLAEPSVPDYGLPAD